MPKITQVTWVVLLLASEHRERRTWVWGFWWSCHRQPDTAGGLSAPASQTLVSDFQNLVAPARVLPWAEEFGSHHHPVPCWCSCRHGTPWKPRGKKHIAKLTSGPACWSGVSLIPSAQGCTWTWLVRVCVIAAQRWAWTMRRHSHNWAADGDDPDGVRLGSVVPHHCGLLFQ